MSWNLTSQARHRFGPQMWETSISYVSHWSMELQAKPGLPGMTLSLRFRHTEGKDGVPTKGF